MGGGEWGSAFVTWGEKRVDQRYAGVKPMDDIVERLRAVTYTRERSDGPGGLYWDEPCDADDCGAEKVLINPNGPEAAAEIERLRAEVGRLREALRLYDDDQHCGLCERFVSSGEAARAALKDPQP